MATPEYLQQVIVSERRQNRRVSSARTGIFQRPSVTSLVWASLDLVTVFVAAVMASRLRLDASGYPTFSLLPHILHSTPSKWLLYLAWYGLSLVFFTRSYGLYGPIQNRSGLHEQRMTVQATVVAGLLLCGALYISREINVSRAVVAMMVAITALLLCIRRYIWRQMEYSRYREGLETRNVLIVGAGRVAHALRNHLESLRHLGFRFKGFVALTEREAETGDADVIGDVRNTLQLARSLFVDEIFLSVPADKKLVLQLVEEARAAGIDIRVVPDLYDGLAWNAPIEYVGQFPTIPLHRRDFPIGSFLMKRVLDLTVSSLGLLLLSPILLLIVLAVKFGSNGPVLYRAARIGRKGRTFNCFKFRTMVPNADHLKADLEHMNEREGVLFKISNDPRITPRRAHPAQVFLRRAAPALQRPARRHEPRRPAPAHRLRGRAVRPRPPAPARRSARHHRPMAGRSPSGPQLRQLHLARHRLRRKLDLPPRPENPPPHRSRSLLRHRLLARLAVVLLPR